MEKPVFFKILDEMQILPDIADYISPHPSNLMNNDTCMKAFHKHLL